MAAAMCGMRRWGRHACLLLGIIAGLLLWPEAAKATPGFARQTGVACEARHTVFPELTPFGRLCKLNGYVFSNVRQIQDISVNRETTLALAEAAPLCVQLEASNTTLAKSMPDARRRHLRRMAPPDRARHRLRARSRLQWQTRARHRGPRHRKSPDLPTGTAGGSHRTPRLEQGARRRSLRDQQSPKRLLPLSLLSGRDRSRRTRSQRRG
jgi:hypothetical protein